MKKKICFLGEGGAGEMGFCGQQKSCVVTSCKLCDSNETL